MILEMKVPSPGESITEVEIAQWLVKDGDYVKKDQAVAEVDSDKATLELPAEQSGIITLKAEEGDAVAVGDIVCIIDTEGKPKDSDSKEKVDTVSKIEIHSDKKPQENHTYASGSPSPAAKKIISEKNIDISLIKGTGKNGRITKDDAIKAKASMGSMPVNGVRDLSTKKCLYFEEKLQKDWFQLKMKQQC